MSRVSIEGWITLDQGRKLLQMAGQDFDALKKQAATRDFKPVPLGVTASMTLHNTLRTIDSRNVIAKLEGRDPKLKDEYVVYTAHWDHLGVGPPVERRRDLQRRARTTPSAAPVCSRSRARSPGCRRRRSGRFCFCR